MRLRTIVSFASGIAVALSLPVMAETARMRFSDVQSTAFFSEAVHSLSTMGVIRGYDNGRFGPGDTVTRGQVAVMLQRYDRMVVEPMREQIEELRRAVKKGECGDGTIQTGERCDDGNRVNGDGCSSTCLLEDTGVLCEGKYHPGESFKSPDGCNTCFCGQNGQAACTLKYCAPDDDDENDDDDEDDDDRDACKPYLCADGTRVPSCSEDGHVINYFAEPCLTHGGPRQEDEETACATEQQNYEKVVSEHVSCRTDADCSVFLFSCPFVTCGSALRKDATDLATAAAQKVADCKQNLGQPLACAMCIEMKASCVSGKCTVKQVRPL